MEHRIRAAVIIVDRGRILLVKHVDPSTGEAWWIPPGGGLLPGDSSIVNCARREVFEETGLNVIVGKLVYLREFIEPDAGFHNISLTFLSDQHSGKLTMEHVKGMGPDEDFIRDLAWFTQAELENLTVYPEHLKDGFWDDLDAGFPQPRYLGVATASGFS